MLQVYRVQTEMCLMSVVKRVVTVLEVKSESYWSSDMLMKLLVSCRLQNTNRNFFV